MTDTTRVHRPRVQTPEQEAAEHALRERLQQERPGLEELIARGDISQVFTMGEYWELCKTLRGLKTLRETQSLSISEVAERAGIDAATIHVLEEGHIDNLTIAAVSRYAKALGKRLVVSLADVKGSGS